MEIYYFLCRHYFSHSHPARGASVIACLHSFCRFTSFPFSTDCCYCQVHVFLASLDAAMTANPGTFQLIFQVLNSSKCRTASFVFSSVSDIFVVQLIILFLEHTRKTSCFIFRVHVSVSHTITGPPLHTNTIQIPLNGTR